ncbi:MAG: hypothetical protein PF636_08880 [Actinomycetota bacterium]|jgi:Tfp pilus assembly protein PilX|nr:hypothetical protein [Actinomycetota bacterium]
MSKPDLDLRWGDEEDPQPHAPAPLEPIPERKPGLALRVALAAVCILAVFSLGACAGAVNGEHLTQEAVEAACIAYDAAEDAHANAELWRSQAEETSATLDLLRRQLASDIHLIAVHLEASQAPSSTATASPTGGL